MTALLYVALIVATFLAVTGLHAIASCVVELQRIADALESKPSPVFPDPVPTLKTLVDSVQKGATTLDRIEEHLR